MFRIGIEQPSDHALVLRVVFSSLILKGGDASLAQCNGDLDPFVQKDKLFGPRKEVRNNSKISERFIGVFNFLAHR